MFGNGRYGSRNRRGVDLSFERNSFGARNRSGAGGYCVCTRCGERLPHRAGIPCRQERCPKCGAAMIREGFYHHKVIEEKKSGGS